MNTETPDEKSVEERIAAFLLENRITIVPVCVDDMETLTFDQYPIQGGEGTEIGAMTYRIGEGLTSGADAEELQRRLKVPGFVRNVTRPLSRLLRQTNGNIYGDRFEPIHEACDRVESNYQAL